MMKCQIYSHAVVQHTLTFSHIIPDALPVVRLWSPPVDNRSVRAVQNMPISKRTQLHGCKCILLPFSSELPPAPSSAFTSSTTTGVSSLPVHNFKSTKYSVMPAFLTVLIPHKVHTCIVQSCTAGLCSVCLIASKLFQYELSSEVSDFKLFFQYSMQVK